jgi:mono/diheme cytochrome c family protein
MKTQQDAVTYPKMKSALIAFVCASLLIAISSMSSAQNARSNSTNAPTAKTPESSAALVARGKYIVEGLSRCGQCHTPRDGNGNPEAGEALQGAAVWLKSAEPVQDWPLKAPRIAGIPPGTDADMIKLLTTGIWNDGKPLRSPMPQFRMTEPDAAAVVAYLKTLP